MRELYLCLLASFLCLAGCGEDNKEELKTKLSAPVDVVAERVGRTLAVNVSWTDNNADETGFNVYVIDPADIDHPALVGSTGRDETSYVVKTGICEAKSFYFGVRAIASDEAYNSAMAKSPLLRLESTENLPDIEILSVDSYTPCVSVRYRLSNVPASATCGVCWSENKNPDIRDVHQSGAQSSDSERRQVISNALLDYGKTYYFRAYAVVDATAYYSEALPASLGKELEKISLTWNKVSESGLPSDIELYETVDKLNGRNFHAWYAIADVAAGNVVFKTLVPSSAATVDAQASAAGNCHVLINGGYFYNGKNAGLSVVSGVVSGSISQVRGSLKSADSEYNELYSVTRGLFGVDASAKPGVFWAGTDAKGTAYYFNRPLPTVKGEAKYGVVSSTNPATSVTWTPQYALSAGPVLLKDGKCPFDFSVTDKGDDYYLSNYEVIAYDIFGTDVHPDRTAVGITSEGKVVLFICDGRITGSQGATLTELAMVLKGIGCTDAVNFDGGGSTGMVVCGKHINDHTAENRAVVSTMGFFSK